MNMKLPVHLAIIIISGLPFAACQKASSQRPAHCPQFDMSSFEPLDTNHDGFLSDSEFQVHRDEMHGPNVPKECHIPYDKGSYERLAGKQGMSRDEFKVHLQEMEKRAAQGGSL